MLTNALSLTEADNRWTFSNLHCAVSLQLSKFLSPFRPKLPHLVSKLQMCFLGTVLRRSHAVFTIPLAQEEKGRANPERRPRNCWTHMKPAELTGVSPHSLSPYYVSLIILIFLSQPFIFLYVLHICCHACTCLFELSGGWVWVCEGVHLISTGSSASSASAEHRGWRRRRREGREKLFLWSSKTTLRRPSPASPSSLHLSFSPATSRSLTLIQQGTKYFF